MQSLYSNLLFSRKQQYLFAALMWTLVGCGLLIRGLICLVSASSYLLLLIVILLGIIKYYIVFRKAAQKNVLRLQSLDRYIFISSIFPLRTWILIAFMIILGLLLRWSPLPQVIYYLIIAGVGLGLFIASAIFWRAWRKDVVIVNNG